MTGMIALGDEDVAVREGGWRCSGRHSNRQLVTVGPWRAPLAHQNLRKSVPAGHNRHVKERSLIPKPMPRAKTTNRPAEPANADPNHDQIATLAYQFWLDRGSPMGAAAIDWFNAEAELKKARQNGRRLNHAGIPYGIKESCAQSV